MCSGEGGGVYKCMCAYWISIEGLEVEAFICYAHMARVGHQRQHHLCCTLHVRPLSYILKASHSQQGLMINYLNLARSDLYFFNQHLSRLTYQFLSKDDLAKRDCRLASI